LCVPGDCLFKYSEYGNKHIEENQTSDFIIQNGVKTLIKRKKFEAFLDRLSSI